ncbi:hypothetical protein Scep_021665 [Stephania cephalantha]|uniref:Uncharacterized protein n=1 Tax=Stephania cephalantha TaxID=152367 RepID=A0AAP0I1K5_9MAGN
MKIVYEVIQALGHQLKTIIDDVPPPIAATSRQSIKELAGEHRKGKPRFSRNKTPSEKKTNKKKSTSNVLDNNINNEENVMKPMKKMRKKVNTIVNVDNVNRKQHSYYDIAAVTTYM